MTQSYLDSLGADDYCAALYRLTEEQGRKVPPEDLISELGADPEEAARCLRIFQEHDLMALHEGFLTLTSGGRANAEFTLAKHARIAEFLAGVLKLSPPWRPAGMPPGSEMSFKGMPSLNFTTMWRSMISSISFRRRN